MSDGAMLFPLCVLAVALVAADLPRTPGDPPGAHADPHHTHTWTHTGNKKYNTFWDEAKIRQENGQTSPEEQALPGVSGSEGKRIIPDENYGRVKLVSNSPINNGPITSDLLKNNLLTRDVQGRRLRRSDDQGRDTSGINLQRSNLPKRSIPLRTDGLDNNVSQTKDQGNNDLHLNTPSTSIIDSESKSAAIIDSGKTPRVITDSDSSPTAIFRTNSSPSAIIDSESNFAAINDSASTPPGIVDSGSPRVVSESDSSPPAIIETDSSPPAVIASGSSVNTTASSIQGGAECMLVPSELLWYFCDEQQLKIKDGDLMEVVCDHAPGTPLDCSALPPRTPTRLVRLEVTDCALPPDLRLSCVGGSAAALSLTQAPSSLTARNVEGMDIDDLFIMARPGAIREIPIDAIRALPRLKEFRLLQGTNISLSPHQFPPAALRYLEVSISGVGELPRAAFASLGNLTTLALFKNNIASIHPDAFQGLSSLRTLILDDNPFSELPPGALPPSLTTLYLQRVGLAALQEGMLTGLQHLEELTVSTVGALWLGRRALARLPALASVRLTGSRVTSLPADLFHLSPALRNLTLSDNSISALPSPLWPQLAALEELDLSNNEIAAFESRTFRGLRALARLRLAGNRIKEIPGEAFSGLRQLSSLSLSHNEVSTISALSFVGAGSLVSLSLSHNRLSWAPAPAQLADDWLPGESSPLNMLLNLQELDLSYNNISVLYSDWRLVLRRLERLHLAHNALPDLSQADQQFLSWSAALVDLSFNNISSVQPRAPWHADVSAGAALRLAGNPFHCDCLLYDFITLVQSHSPKYEDEGLACASPPSLAGVPLAGVALGEVTCPLSDVTACACLIRAHDERVECDCPRLQDVPDISSTGVRQMALQLRHAPADWSRLPPAVTRLQLSRLNLTHTPARIPASVTHIDLTHNHIQLVSEDFLKRNVTLKLEHNDLNCDCFSTDNVRNLQKFAEKIVDYDAVKCADGSLVKQKDANTICDVYKSYISGSVIAFGLILFACVLAATYTYRVEIQVIMYRRRWCLFLLPKEHDDRDKTYDVFLSFAHEDEKFVLDEILPEINVSYSLHVQGRDWEVGGTIPEQIHTSVESSRKTLIVLSKNYLKSRWASEVFRSVHSQATNDKVTRAVTVTTDVHRKALDKDVRTFLSLSTFITYKESLFWDKLRFALPRKDMLPHKFDKKDIYGNAFREEIIQVWKNPGLNVTRNKEGQLVNIAYAKDI